MVKKLKKKSLIEQIGLKLAMKEQERFYCYLRGVLSTPAGV